MKLAYKSMGSGSPMIVLHGLYGSSDNWMTIAGNFKDKYEIFLVDQRNHGDSPHHAEHTFPAMANDLNEFLTQHQLASATVLGHSMGGKTAIWFAAMYPELVDKLIVVDVGVKGYPDNATPSAKGTSHPNIIKSMMETDPSGSKSRTEIGKRLEERIGNSTVVQFLLKNLKRDANNGFYWQLNLEAIRDNLEAIFAGLDESDVKDRAKLESMPVLFIRGDRSPYIEKGDFEGIKHFFPKAKIETVEGAGHWVHAEKPEEFLRILDNFLIG